MTARSIFSTPDAVTNIVELGDRIDKLERFRSDPGAPRLAASYWPLTTIPGDGSNTRVGVVTLPAGYSRLQVAAFFSVTEDGDTLTGAGIIFPAGWEETHVLAGGFTDTTGIAAIFRASGVGLMRSSSRVSDSFYVRANTASGSPAVAVGSLFVEPVDSLSFD